MSERTAPLAFAYCAKGERYEKMAAQSVLTLKEQMPGADVRFLNPDDALAVFERFGGIEVPNAHLMGTRWGGPKSLAPMLSRLAIPLLPQFADCRRVFWMDCDTEVVSPDIKLLADIDLGNCAIGACRDLPIQLRDRCAYLHERLGCPRRWCYKCSGTLLFDLPRLEGHYEDVLQVMLETLRTRFDVLRYPDQDLLNAFCDLYRLPQRYDCFIGYIPNDRRYDWDVPVVKHYCGAGKKLYRPRKEVWGGQ